MVGIGRGDIWLVDLNPVRGSEQRGVRPYVVFSNDIANEYAPTVCVVPLTSNLSGQRFPTNVLLSRSATGLKQDSLLLGGQLRTVAKERLLRKLATVAGAAMLDVERAVKLYLGFTVD